ncbi:uncharacterized protein LOC132196443 [Neocloeon triangulifer]|uniref:uncharacterized protein LOC132196443 n=1 Tax=Neocloeon triangulifer TaxID=2078957 RepID=UPI00286F82A3|nr:uncharacterized protein LOC132196443 [Neocloeon triangulifer]
MREDPFEGAEKSRKWRNHHKTNCKETEEDHLQLGQKFVYELESGRSLIPAADRLLLFLRGAGRRRHSKCGLYLVKMGLAHVPDEQIPVLLLRLIADKGTPARLRCPEDFVVEVIETMANLGVSLHYLYYMGGTLLDSSRNRYLMSAVMANVRKVGRLLLERGTTVEQLVTAPNGVRRCADGSGHSPISFCLWHFQFYTDPGKDLLEWVELLLFHGASFVLQRENNINLDKSVPHYLIEHLFVFVDDETPWVPTALKLLHLYRESGGRMWTKQNTKHGAQNALEYADFERLEFDMDVIQAMMKTPRSLMSLCRNCIKKAVGRQFWREAPNLGLPRELTSYIMNWNYEEEFKREYGIRLVLQSPSVEIVE